MSKVVQQGDCWVWQGATCGAKDYGLIHVPSDSPHRSRLVHRISYEVHVGEIPDGLDLDHLCLNTRCVNPWHLEPVPNVVNVRRRAAARTHCKRGHELTPDNYLSGGRRGRVCKACHNAHGREWHRKQAVLRREAISHKE